MTPFGIASTYTPEGLVFTEESHAYTLAGRPLLSVTGVLRAAGLIDTAWFTEADRLRGTAVHRAIEDRFLLRVTRIETELRGYLEAFDAFETQSGFEVEACEERLADPLLRCAGTLDLRGRFPAMRLARPGERATILRTTSPRIDLIDVKTGSAPPWVGYQLAGYVRLLPAEVRAMCRRWCLQLRADGTYRLWPLTERHDECVFLAALTIAQVKRGWL